MPRKGKRKNKSVARSKQQKVARPSTPQPDVVFYWKGAEPTLDGLPSELTNMICNYLREDNVSRDLLSLSETSPHFLPIVQSFCKEKSNVPTLHCIEICNMKLGQSSCTVNLFFHAANVPLYDLESLKKRIKSREMIQKDGKPLYRINIPIHNSKDEVISHIHGLLSNSINVLRLKIENKASSEINYDMVDRILSDSKCRNLIHTGYAGDNEYTQILPIVKSRSVSALLIDYLSWPNESCSRRTFDQLIDLPINVRFTGMLTDPDWDRNLWENILRDKRAEGYEVALNGRRIEDVRDNDLVRSLHQDIEWCKDRSSILYTLD